MCELLLSVHMMQHQPSHKNFHRQVFWESGNGPGPSLSQNRNSSKKNWATHFVCGYVGAYKGNVLCLCPSVCGQPCAYRVCSHMQKPHRNLQHNWQDPKERWAAYTDLQQIRAEESLWSFSQTDLVSFNIWLLNKEGWEGCLTARISQNIFKIGEKSEKLSSRFL